jgi:hypothetical protein
LDKLISNLGAIEDWIANAPDPASFQTNDEFMVFIVELMSRSLYLLRTCISLVSSEEIAARGHSKHNAIIVGHMVRTAKLYEGLLIHISSRQLELAAIFSRLIFETTIRTIYLINSKSKRKSIRSFILASYKPEKEILKDLKNKASTRPLIPIEKRMRRKIQARLKKDGISIGELMKNKVWDIDSKNFREILKHLGFGSIYSYGFGSSSHAVHGDWYEISQHHIAKTGRFYSPKLNYDDPDPRIACSLTHLCLDALLIFLKWAKSDPDQIVTPTVRNLLDLNRSISNAHEDTLGA